MEIFPKFQIIEKDTLFDIDAKLESVSEYSIRLYEITNINFISNLDVLKNNDDKNGNSIIKENIGNINYGTQIINIGNENKNIIKNTTPNSKDKKFSMENPIFYIVFSLILTYIIYYLGIK